MDVAGLVSKWENRSAAEHDGSALFCTIDICRSYQLEAADREHRRGFVLREKMAEFTREAQCQRSNLSWPYSYDFWGWLNAQAGGKEVPRVWHVPTNELDNYRVEFSGNVVSRPTNLTEGCTGIAEIMYVMNSRGTFYANRKTVGSATSYAFHHSSFFRGGRVAGAGSFYINGVGKLVRLTDWSGHYEPTCKETYNVMKSLQLQGVNIDEIEYFSWQTPSSIVNAGKWKKDFERSRVVYLPTGRHGQCASRCYRASQGVDKKQPQLYNGAASQR